MIPTGPVPDALKIPERMKRGGTQYERVDGICSIAESLLGADRSAGQRAYLRKQGDGPAAWLFVTLSPDDTLYGTSGTPFYGRRRYDWIERPDLGGISLGYLRDEFRGVEVKPIDPVAAGIHRYGY